MANRSKFGSGAILENGELNDEFLNLETAVWNLAVDLGLLGVISGLGVTQNGAASARSVRVAAGVALDKNGKRLKLAAYSDRSVASDSSGNTTDITNVGEYRWLSIFLQYAKDGSDPRTDDN